MESQHDSDAAGDGEEEGEEEVEEATPLKGSAEAEDGDLFEGSFARPASSTPKSAASLAWRASRRKLARRSPRLKNPQDNVNSIENFRKDEEDIRKDEFLKLCARLKEDRLVGIIPLDCNPTLV